MERLIDFYRNHRSEAVSSSYSSARYKIKWRKEKLSLKTNLERRNGRLRGRTSKRSHWLALDRTHWGIPAPIPNRQSGNSSGTAFCDVVCRATSTSFAAQGSVLLWRWQSKMKMNSELFLGKKWKFIVFFYLGFPISKMRCCFYWWVPPAAGGAAPSL